jgi:GTPase SAR1 family protein
MADSEALQHWHDLHEHLSDWAFRAYDRLIDELSEDLQEKLRLKDGAEESYVVIFGKTQVGKTTLLLDLMGVKQEREFMDKVSQVLRGGRETGKSATATAMEYCRSADERWGIALTSEPNWFIDDESVTRRLGKIREDMEAGRLTTDKPCVVHIPLRFFKENRTTAPQVRILDLPGDNPANQQEQKHVSQMASTYLPFADLILLVGRGDDLSFLSSDVITLPVIEDWQAMPHRFRIVTTYSYTAKSVKDMIRHDESIDATELRKRLIEQIEKFDTLSEAARAPDLYFPLEFGTSWKGMREQKPSLHERIEPIICELREVLLTQIRQCNSPMGRLRSTWKTHISVKHVRQKKNTANAAQQAGLRKKINDQDADIDFWQRKIRHLKYLKSKLEQLNSIAQRVLIADLKFEPILEGQSLPSDNNKDAATLRQMVITLKHCLQKMRPSVNATDVQQSKYSSRVEMYLKEPDQDPIRETLRNSFKSINDKLNSFLLDRYFITDNYNADKNEIIKAGQT